MGVHVGMDVHRKRSQIAIVDEAGDQQRNRNLANDPAKLVPILGTLPPGTPVAFEAAYGWGWLVELLEELELEPHLVHPSRCKAIAAARLKNDKVDAATLAQLLRADLLPEAWIAPQPVRDLRALLPPSRPDSAEHRTEEPPCPLAQLPAWPWMASSWKGAQVGRVNRSGLHETVPMVVSAA
jgi:transposase